ncbi:MAG: hypothetical protein LBG17_04675 [Bacteroidales bacterium]|jgi:hypothetical protein|nr:hypothetical protein [Bacteroidales bacterium]
MKQKILDALKAKFTGVSDIILGGIAEKLAKTATTEESVTTAVEGVTFQSILEQYGDSRATQASNTAISNYEKKHNLKDGKAAPQPAPQPAPIPVPQPNPQPAQGGDTPQDILTAINKIVAAINPLTDRISALEGARTTETRRGKLNDILSKLPEQLRKPYARMDISGLSDEDFAAALTEVSSEIEGIMALDKSKGAAFEFPSQGKNGNNTASKPSDEAVKAVMAALPKV